MLEDLLAELAGDVPDSDGHGALLQQVPVPEGMAGRTYGELFMSFAQVRAPVSWWCAFDPMHVV